jgi:hypothetical protein
MTTGRNSNSARRLTQIIMYLVLFLAALASLANAQASRNKKPSSKPANSTNGSPTTFTLDVDQMYCDESLPYIYQSDPSTVTLNVGVAQNTGMDHDPAKWANLMGKLWTSASTLPSTVQVNFEAKTTYSTDDKGKDATTNDAPTAKGLIDDGLTILGDPKHEFSDDTFDAQRLLVRTLFGPNPFQVACADAYLRYPNGDVPTGALPQLTKGAGYPFSLNDKNAPQYYLINIVRWKDTTPSKGTSTSTAPPPTMPFFQAASDNWYLLNYSDSQDRKQDISQWFHKITPSMLSDTLRIIGSSKVMFLGVHLAPLPALDPNVLNPNPKSAPATEQAWFDAISLKYTFQASAATPTNIADLNTLLSIVLGNIGLSIPQQQQQQNNPASALTVAQDVPSAMTKLHEAVQTVNNKLNQDELDVFLRQPNLASYVTVQHYGIESDSKTNSALLKLTPVEKNQGPTEFIVDPDVEAQINKLAESNPKNATTLNAIQQDIEAMSRLQAAISSAKTLLSTYQGRYAAGLLTNLKNLPVTLASNWTANFSAVTISPKWAGTAGVYDLTKTNATADAKKPNGKPGDTSAPPTSPAPGSGGTGSANPSSGLGTASSTHHGFGPWLAASDVGGLYDFIDDPPQDSTQSAKGTPASDSGAQPTDGKTKDGKTNDGKTSKDKNSTKKSSTTSNSSKNATATASTICTISLTKGSNTDNPVSSQHQSDCSDQQTKILDEGRSRWDVSVLVPTPGYKDLTFQAAASGSSGPNIITAKTITRENAYGVFDIYLIPEDLITPPYLGIPHVVVGLPFAGQVFNKPYFAVGETINFPKAIAKIPIVSKLPFLSSLAQKDLPLFVRPVFGWVDNKVYPTGGAPTYRSLKPQFSIEMSFSSIKNAVQTLSKNSSNGSGNTTKPTTPSSVPSSN